MRLLISPCLILLALVLPVSAQSTLLVPSQYFTIQNAITAAVNGDTIIVDPGYYTERLSTTGKAIVIKSSQGPEVTTIDATMGGPALSFITGETAATEIDGFSLVNGAGFPIAVINNKVIRAGGAVYILGASPTIRNCIMENNSADRGGAVDVSGSAFFDRCIIRSNHAASRGGGISFMPGGLPIFENCEVRQNICNKDGGGVSVEGSATAFMVNCLVADNLLPGVGYRHSNRIGGGIYLQSGAALTLACSTVAGNFATFGGGIGSDGNLNGLVVRNSVIWHNAGQSIRGTSGIASVQYSSIQGGHVGLGNLATDPKFVDQVAGDYHLALGSPCINVGTSGSFFIPATDIDNEVRQIYGAPDMGCDEVVDIGASAALAGNAGMQLGIPADLLLVNGSSGSFSRRVAVPVGSPNTVSMLQPVTVSQAANFAIFGYFGLPTEADQITLPLGIGDMAFTPHVLIPFAFPQVFTFTHSAGAVAGAAVASTPTPWTSPPQAGFPVPVTLSLQGVIEEMPGVLRATNCVILVIE